MGYGIPAAIGACFATNKQWQVICLVGDGGAMLNLQELQTIKHHNLPIAIFVFANNAYMTMQFTQNTHFKREAASSPDSGVSCPNFSKLARAFGIPDLTIRVAGDLALAFDHAVFKRRLGPMLATVEMPHGQLLQPRVMSRMENGKFVPTPIDHMWPYLKELETAK